MSEKRSGWVLDKHVNIPIIIALVINSGMLIWYASKLDSRVAYLESNYMQEQAKNERLLDRLRVVESGMARMEGKIDAIIAASREIR